MSLGTNVQPRIRTNTDSVRVRVPWSFTTRKEPYLPDERGTMDERKDRVDLLEVYFNEADYDCLTCGVIGLPGSGGRLRVNSTVLLQLVSRTRKVVYW